MAAARHRRVEEVFDLKLGWDVTAFGGNNLQHRG